MGKIGLKNISKIDPELTNELIFFVPLPQLTINYKKIMKREIFALMGLACLVFTSCSKDKEEKDPLIGEWVAEKVVFGGKDLGIDDCTKQTRVSISEKQFNYYVFYKDNSRCLSTLTSYDYVKEGNTITNPKDNKGFFFSLEDNDTRLRISQTNENYVIFHRK